MPPTYDQVEAVLANQAALQAWLDWFKASLPAILCAAAFVQVVLLSAFLGITRAFGRRGL
jgi:hypothetical protein